MFTPYNQNRFNPISEFNFVNMQAHLFDMMCHCYIWVGIDTFLRVCTQLMFCNIKCVSFELPFVLFLSSYVSLCYFILDVFIDHRQVIGRTLIHEFHTFYSNVDWNLLSSLCEIGDNFCKKSDVKLNCKLKKIDNFTILWLFDHG